jgi:hypothetical protein
MVNTFTATQIILGVDFAILLALIGVYVYYRYYYTSTLIPDSSDPNVSYIWALYGLTILGIISWAIALVIWFVSIKNINIALILSIITLVAFVIALVLEGVILYNGQYSSSSSS